MKNSTEILLLAALIASAFVLPSLKGAETDAPADRPNRMAERRMDRQENLGRMAGELNLTADQQARIKAIRQGSAGELEALRDNTELNRQQKREQLQAMRDDIEARVEAVLTPEQRAKAKELRAQRPQRPDRPGNGEDRPARRRAE